MSEYNPPFKITNKVLSYVASISEKIGKVSAITNLESKPHLRRNNRIKSIHSSLKIEANSLTLGQVRDVINGKMVLGEQREIQEVKNAYTAYEKMKEINVSTNSCFKILIPLPNSSASSISCKLNSFLLSFLIFLIIFE